MQHRSDRSGDPGGSRARAAFVGLLLVVLAASGTACRSTSDAGGRGVGRDGQARAYVFSPLDTHMETYELMAIGSLAPAKTKPSSTARRFKPGDEVIVELTDIPDGGRYERVLDHEGFVQLPFIGRVEFAGKTTPELEQEIERLYVDGEWYPRITVSVRPPPSFFFVRGAVQRPGQYPLTRGQTVMQGIDAAGGANRFAHGNKVHVIRNGRTIEYRIDALQEMPEAKRLIQDGDVIEVPEGIL
jgi:protein involved in polysaccharide export with SLBB domain